VRSYEGRDQEEAGSRFAAEAQQMASQGYFPVAQSWQDRQLTVADQLMWVDVGPRGTLTVTYRRGLTSGAAVAQVPLSEKLRQLDEAHRAGLLTEDEYRQKRSALIDAF
jgi:hypothetical protein